MNHEPAMGRIASGARRPVCLMFASFLLLLVSQAHAQTQYVGRFEVYEGFMYLDSPHMSLAEPGYHIQAGVRAKKWVSLGFDYSRGTGNSALTSNLLSTSLQQQLNSAISSGLLPAGYRLSVPLENVTQTFTAGPQFPYRRFSKFTPFFRPVLGAVKEMTKTHPNDAVTTLIVSTLAPTGKLEDWRAFYGFGGGVAFNVSRHFSLVVQADLVHDHLFSDFLKDGRNTIRLSIGPGFQFGKNIVR